MNHHPRSESVAQVRRAVAARALAAPDRFAGEELAFVRLPGGHGVVPVVGLADHPLERWTIEGTDITVAQMHAVADQIRHGLGWWAGLGWSTPTFAGLAVGWGATAHEAVGHLVADLRDLWIDVEGAVVAKLVDGAWRPGERRTSDVGVAITAPRWDGDRVAVDACRGLVDLRVTADPAGHWLSALRTAVAAHHPLTPAVRFGRAHADGGYPDAFAWPLAGAVSGGGEVKPATPFSAAAAVGAPVA